MNAMARRRRQAGFTLIELMVALVVSGIVVLGIYAFSTIQQSTAGLHERNVRIQQSLEGSMWSMGQDIRTSGLGFARLCSELRVYDGIGDGLINPGAFADVNTARLDDYTDAPYWVLRDGLQVHWNSSAAGQTLAGLEDTSADASSLGDSFDVITAEGNYLGSHGIFILELAVAGGDTHLSVRTSDQLDNTNPDHLAQVQQLFPPGTFMIVSRLPALGTVPFRPELQGQCPLLQVMDDVEADAGDAQVWRIPIAGTSGFNEDLGTLFGDSNGDVNGGVGVNPGCGGATCDDWEPAGANPVDNIAGQASVIPLGRLRWSRYELDWSVPAFPYLVRYDIIGFQPANDPGGLGSVDYPHCASGECEAPQLHLPGPSATQPPTAVAIGPMVEDLQIAVGCDGYTAAAAATAGIALPDNPGQDLAEVGPQTGPTALTPNFTVDENPSGNERTTDEWLGNAVEEEWHPDCVWYGTGQYNSVAWDGLLGGVAPVGPPTNVRMSPQTLRITLVASSEEAEQAGGLSTAELAAIEDREPLNSTVGPRQRFHLTERFTPKNLRWRDSTVN